MLLWLSMGIHALSCHCIPRVFSDNDKMKHVRNRLFELIFFTKYAIILVKIFFQSVELSSLIIKVKYWFPFSLPELMEVMLL